MSVAEWIEEPGALLGGVEQRALALVEMSGAAPGLALLLVARDGSISWAGEGLQRLAGRDGRELAGQPLRALFGDAGEAAVRASIADRAQLRAGTLLPLALLGRDGRRTPVRAVVTEAPGAERALLVLLHAAAPAPEAGPGGVGSLPVPALLVRRGIVEDASAPARADAVLPAPGTRFEDHVGSEHVLVARERIRRAERGERARPLACAIGPRPDGAARARVVLEFWPYPSAGPGAALLVVRRAEAQPGARPAVAPDQLRLLAELCHDLQNPLAAARGYVQMLSEERVGPLQAEQKPALRSALRALERATTLVSGCMDLAVGELAPVRATEELDVAELLRETCAQLGERARSADVELEVRPGPAGCRARSEPGALARVLDNLVANAIKHNQRGGTVVLTWRELGARELLLEVSDTGVGIRPADRERVFEPFRRCGSGAPGLGLGLAIVRGLVERHAGKIDIDSPPQGGTRVLVTWPRAERPENTNRSVMET
ncbi:MAG: PAS domain-containing sensor histidine kinase [Acidobacteria bacterium]|nr:PAS domain-containing sensor histidine kinase [Acidobacteriota bacterium]